MGGKGSGGYRKNALPRDKNPVVQGNDPSNVVPEANDKALRQAMAMARWDGVDLSDHEAVATRLDEFLTLCNELDLRPLMEAFCMAFGQNRQEMLLIVQGDSNAIRRQRVTAKSLDILQKGYEILRVVWETNLAYKTGNPVGDIFFGKNHYGYKDETVRVERRVDETPQLSTPEEIAAKYLKRAGRPEAIEVEAVVEVIPDSETPRLSDSDADQDV